MRLFAWLRGRYRSETSSGIACRTDRRIEIVEHLADDLADSIENVVDRLAELAGPLPASDGLSLATLQQQICDLQTKLQNCRASLRTIRDVQDSQGQRIAAMESRMDHYDDKFASRTDVLANPSLN